LKKTGPDATDLKIEQLSGNKWTNMGLN